MKVETGKKFGYLKVLELNNSHHYGNSWVCECICGKKLKMLESELIGRPKRPPTKSCGCKRKAQKGLTAKHGDLYQKWGDAIRRCYKDTAASLYYKEKGITVCEEWRTDFGNFVEWALLNGYEEGLTLDRIDCDGNYEPSNCRWATNFVQSQNRGVQRNNSSGAEGVIKKPSGRYQATLNRKYKHYHLGTFDTFEEAAEYRRQAEEYYDLNDTLENYKNNEAKRSKPKCQESKQP